MLSDERARRSNRSTVSTPRYFLSLVLFLTSKTKNNSQGLLNSTRSFFDEKEKKFSNMLLSEFQVPRSNNCSGFRRLYPRTREREINHRFEAKGDPKLRATKYETFFGIVFVCSWSSTEAASLIVQHILNFQFEDTINGESRMMSEGQNGRCYPKFNAPTRNVPARKLTQLTESRRGSRGLDRFTHSCTFVPRTFCFRVCDDHSDIASIT